MYSTMQSRGSYGFKNLELCTSCTCIYYIYMVCIRAEPAIFEKKEITGADLEGRGGPDPWNYQNIHLREQHFKIFGVIRG